jgi:hypothetical protein
VAFGQSAGPPATARQLRELLELVNEAGHLDFRDARGPLGLTQRQAAGKFTRDEADELIAQLQEQTAPGPDEGRPTAEPEPEPSGPRPKRSGANATSPGDGRLRHVPSEELAAELQRRGWAVLEP